MEMFGSKLDMNDAEYEQWKLDIERQREFEHRFEGMRRALAECRSGAPGAVSDNRSYYFLIRTPAEARTMKAWARRPTGSREAGGAAPPTQVLQQMPRRPRSRTRVKLDVEQRGGLH